MNLCTIRSDDFTMQYGSHGFAKYYPECETISIEDQGLHNYVSPDIHPYCELLEINIQGKVHEGSFLAL